MFIDCLLVAIKAGTSVWTKGKLCSEPLTVSVALGKVGVAGGYIPIGMVVFPLCCGSHGLLSGRTVQL
jgi:hypothetical protein